jgi:hypothetical protein
LSLQPIPPCTSQSGFAQNNKTVHLTAGHFCNGLYFRNGATAHLGAGVYYIDDRFQIDSNSRVYATSGTTLVINGDYDFRIRNNSVLEITAPSTGPYAGIAMMSPRTASPSREHRFDSNSIVKVEGALYFPNQGVYIRNNTVIGDTDCTQIIVRTIKLYNNLDLDTDCDGVGITPIGGDNSSELVE